MTAQDIYYELLTDFNHDRIDTKRDLEILINDYVADAAYSAADTADQEEIKYDGLYAEVMEFVASDAILTNIGVDLDPLDYYKNNDYEFED